MAKVFIKVIRNQIGLSNIRFQLVLQCAQNVWQADIGREGRPTKGYYGAYNHPVEYSCDKSRPTKTFEDFCSTIQLSLKSCKSSSLVGQWFFWQVSIHFRIQVTISGLLITSELVHILIFGWFSLLETKIHVLFCFSLLHLLELLLAEHFEPIRILWLHFR